MIKFFRKLRQKLINEGNLKRYLVYAIGEILLVVIGILIALQINNLNEQKKDKAKESQILLSLSEDFKSNIVNLKTSIDQYPDLIHRLQTTLSYIGKSEKKLSEGMKDTIRNTGYVFTELVDGTLNSILNSEKLELIQNEKLKRKLTAYPAIVSRFTKQEENLEEYVINVQRDKLRNFVSLTELLPDDNPQNKIIKATAKKSDYFGLLNDMYYQNILTGLLLTNNRMSNIAIELMENTEEVLEILELETRESE